jgi:hypothetical protein
VAGGSPARHPVALHGDVVRDQPWRGLRDEEVGIIIMMPTSSLHRGRSALVSDLRPGFV